MGERGESFRVGRKRGCRREWSGVNSTLCSLLHSSAFNDKIEGRRTAYSSKE
jgi:hypothetical protein